MTKPLVSVALATLNGASFLRQQLDSIYAQSWAPIEVVVSDDASVDATVSILDEYARARGLRYSRNERRLGLVQNFERAISLCQGELIALSDQDDIWKPHKLERLIDQMGAATLAYCCTQEVLDVDGRIGMDRSLDPILEFQRRHGSGHPTRYLLAENWVVSHTLLFRRELVERALPIPPHQPFHDGWLALVASTMGGVVYVDECLQVYRRHPRSLTFKQADAAPSSAWARLFGGGFKTAWLRRAGAEAARIGDALDHAGLPPEDREFAHQLLLYYGARGAPSGRWRAFRAAVRVAPFFSTNDGRSRWRFALRALIGNAGAPAPGGPAAS